MVLILLSKSSHDELLFQQLIFDYDFFVEWVKRIAILIVNRTFFEQQAGWFSFVLMYSVSTKSNNKDHLGKILPLARKILPSDPKVLPLGGKTLPI